MVSIPSTAPGDAALIKPATWRDLNSVRQLEHVCFPKDVWPLWDLVGVLTFPNVIRLKAVDNGTLVGFIAADLRPYENRAWIATVGVLPEYRRRGIGNALLEACEAQIQAPSIRLNVRISNQYAVRMYHMAGYQEVGIWPAYYEDGEGALVMEKVLSR